jgi:hypothetical protein
VRWYEPDPPPRREPKNGICNLGGPDTVKQSDRHILTSHAGSLPRPEALLEVNRLKLTGEAYDEKLYAETLSAAVEQICHKQAETGVDVINDGEFGKASFGAIDYGAWSSYAWARLTGWEPGEPGRLPALAGRRDRQKFAEFYAELDATNFRRVRSAGGLRCSPGRSLISGSRRCAPTLRTSRPHWLR